MGARLGGRAVDMTTGPLFKKILMFALPLALTNLLQQLYNVADMVIVGRFSAVEGTVAAIGSTMSFHTLMVNFLIGLSVGATVVVSQAIGARDDIAAERGVHTALLMGLALGIINLILGQLLCCPILELLNTQYMELAEEYCRIYFMGLPFVALLNCSLGILRAQGDTTRPLFILAGAGVLNVVLNLVFVVCLGMDVDGVGWATVISNASSAAAALICLARDRGICRLSLRKLRVHWRTAKQILLVGIPSGLQGVLFSVSNMIIQSAVNSFGPITVTAASITGNLEAFGYTAGNSAAQASLAFTGQNMGAKNYRRIIAVVHNSMMVGFLLSSVLSVLLYILQVPIAGLYMNATVTNRQEILDTLWLIASFRVLLIPLCSIGECGTLALRGMGYSTLSMLNSLVSACLLRIVWIYTVFAVFPTVWGLYLCYPVTWVVAAVLQYVCVRLKCRRLVCNSERVPV